MPCRENVDTVATITPMHPVHERAKRTFDLYRGPLDVLAKLCILYWKADESVSRRASMWIARWLTATPWDATPLPRLCLLLSTTFSVAQSEREDGAGGAGILSLPSGNEHVTGIDRDIVMGLLSALAGWSTIQRLVMFFRIAGITLSDASMMTGVTDAQAQTLEARAITEWVRTVGAPRSRSLAAPGWRDASLVPGSMDRWDGPHLMQRTHAIVSRIDIGHPLPLDWLLGAEHGALSHR